MKKILLNKYMLILLAIVAGILIGRWTSGDSDSQEYKIETSSADTQIWTCSMHPQIRQPEAGNCPLCGMELIPLSNAEEENDVLSDAIKMSPTAMQLAQITTAIVSDFTKGASIALNGRIKENEQQTYQQTAHFPARVESMTIDYDGAMVKKGQKIASLYAPELQTAQRELLEAYKMKDSQPYLYKAAVNKLLNWKISQQQIDQIISSGEVQERFPLLSDFTGYVSNRRIKEGDHLKQGEVIYEVTNLSSVWVMLDIYEDDLNKINIHDKVKVSVRAYPGQEWQAEISYIDPVINANTRVAQARVVLSNPQFKLKPEMLVTAHIQSKESMNNVLSVPESAVLWTGERSLVYVKIQNEKGVYFRMREVRLGDKVGDQYLILRGLNKGEEIAVNGVFSIDAAAQLAAKPSMMNGDESTADRWILSGEEKQKLAEVINNYLEIKNALVSDHVDNAKLYSSKMELTIKKANLETAESWIGLKAEILKELSSISKAEDIDSVRQHFQQLSNSIIELIKHSGPFNTSLFIQHCPMADNNKGARWISQEKEVQNPYFGSAMLSCGEVIKVLN